MRLFKLLAATALILASLAASAQTPKTFQVPKATPFQARIIAYRKALEAREYKKALTELNAAIALQPGAESQLAQEKVTLLLRTDKQAAYGYVKKTADEKLQGQALALNNIAWALVSDKDPLPRSFYTLGIEVAQRAVSMGESGKPAPAILTLPYSLDTLAYAYYKVGDIAKAVKIQEKALAAAAKDKRFPPSVMKELKEHQALFLGKVKV